MTTKTQCPQCWESVDDGNEPRPCQLHRFARLPSHEPRQTQRWEYTGEDASKIVRCIRFPPEMTDGEHSCPVEVSDGTLLAQTLQSWAENAKVGDEVTLKIIEMTRKELEELPSI
jgi:hypothetical protein